MAISVAVQLFSGEDKCTEEQMKECKTGSVLIKLEIDIFWGHVGTSL